MMPEAVSLAEMAHAYLLYSEKTFLSVSRMEQAIDFQKLNSTKHEGGVQLDQLRLKYVIEDSDR